MAHLRQGGLRWAALVGSVVALVVVPWVLWGAAVETWVQELIVTDEAPEHVVIWVVALLVADVFLPIPSSIVAVAAGVFLGAAVGTIANFLGLTVGCCVGYVFGAQLGPAAAQKLVGGEDWERARGWARRFGATWVLFLRAVPVFAEASTFYAGATRVPFKRFVAACSLGNAVIAVVYACVGSFSAESGDLEPALMAGFLIPGVAMLAVRLISRRMRSEREDV